MKVINNNIKKLTSDMINFLDVQKFDKNIPLYNHICKTDFSKILKDKLLLFEKTALLNNIKLKSIVNDNIIIKADPYAMDRIINNILSNAIKFTLEGGEIFFRLVTEEDKIIFSVEDTGIGIDKINLENIFKPYYQISHNKRNIQGIGIGLYIVKKIIDSINGSLVVKLR